MLSCWKRDPVERPTFANLVLQTSELLQDMKDYLPLLTLQQQDSLMKVCQDQPYDFYISSVPEEKQLEFKETAQ